MTDRERLTQAFEALRAQGFIAEENCMCCGTCATHECYRLASEDPTRNKFVYYHDQDREAMDEGHGVYLGFDTLTPGNGFDPVYIAAGVAAGHEIVAALHDAGLQTQWNGTLDQRIYVEIQP